MAGCRRDASGCGCAGRAGAGSGCGTPLRSGCGRRAPGPGVDRGAGRRPVQLDARPRPASSRTRDGGWAASVPSASACSGAASTRRARLAEPRPPRSMPSGGLRGSLTPTPASSSASSAARSARRRRTPRKRACRRAVRSVGGQLRQRRAAPRAAPRRGRRRPPWWSPCSASGSTPSTTPSRSSERASTRRASAARGAGGGVLPEDRRAALRGDHGVHGVLAHQHHVGDGQRERSAAAALAGDDRDDRHRQARQQPQVLRDRHGLPLLLGGHARERARGVDERDQRQPQLGRRAASPGPPCGSRPGWACRSCAGPARPRCGPSGCRRARPACRPSTPRPPTIAGQSAAIRSPCSSVELLEDELRRSPAWSAGRAAGRRARPPTGRRSASASASRTTTGAGCARPAPAGRRPPAAAGPARARSSARGAMRSTIPCSSRNSAVWKPAGSVSPDRLRDDPRAGEPEPGARLGHDHVARAWRTTRRRRRTSGR